MPPPPLSFWLRHCSPLSQWLTSLLIAGWLYASSTWWLKVSSLPTFENIVAGMAKQNVTTYLEAILEISKTVFVIQVKVFVGENVFCELLRFSSHHLKKKIFLIFCKLFKELNPRYTELSWNYRLGSIYLDMPILGPRASLLTLRCREALGPRMGYAILQPRTQASALVAH